MEGGPLLKNEADFLRLDIIAIVATGFEIKLDTSLGNLWIIGWGIFFLSLPVKGRKMFLLWKYILPVRPGKKLLERPKNLWVKIRYARVLFDSQIIRLPAENWPD